MAYSYHEQKLKLLCERGISTLIQVRDNATILLNTAGAFKACKAWTHCSGDSWLMLAALDYLVEKGELRRLTPVGTVAGQDEIFTNG